MHIGGMRTFGRTSGKLAPRFAGHGNVAERGRKVCGVYCTVQYVVIKIKKQTQCMSRRAQARVPHAAQASEQLGTSSRDPNMTRTILERVDALQAATGQAGGAGGRTTYSAFKATDDAWLRLRTMPVSA